MILLIMKVSHVLRRRRRLTRLGYTVANGTALFTVEEGFEQQGKEKIAWDRGQEMGKVLKWRVRIWVRFLPCENI